jgi:hypothetical protein
LTAAPSQIQAQNKPGQKTTLNLMATLQEKIYK